MIFFEYLERYCVAWRYKWTSSKSFYSWDSPAVLLPSLSDYLLLPSSCFSFVSCYSCFLRVSLEKCQNISCLCDTIRKLLKHYAGNNFFTKCMKNCPCNWLFKSLISCLSLFGLAEAYCDDSQNILKLSLCGCCARSLKHENNISI